MRILARTLCSATRVRGRGRTSASRARKRAEKKSLEQLTKKLEELRDAPLDKSLEALRAAPKPVRRGAGALVAPLIDRVVTLRRDPGAAVEAHIRLVQGGLVSENVECLTAVVRAAALDPTAEDRSARVLSIISHLASCRLMPDASFIYECFKIASDSANLQLSATLHSVALSSRFVAWPSSDRNPFLDLLRTSALPGDPCSSSSSIPPIPSAAKKHSTDIHQPLPLPPVIDYYNGLVRVSLLLRQHASAAAAFRELHARKAGANERTIGLLAAAHAELDDAPGAHDLVGRLRQLGTYPHSIAYAALIRYSGRRRSFDGVRQWVEHAVDEGRVGLSSVTTGSKTRVSAQTLAAAGEDVALAAFFTARSAADVDGAIWLLRYIEENEKVVLSPFVLSVVADTAWRGNRPKTARSIYERIEQRRKKEAEDDAQSVCSPPVAEES